MKDCLKYNLQICCIIHEIRKKPIVLTSTANTTSPATTIAAKAPALKPGEIADMRADFEENNFK